MHNDVRLVILTYLIYGVQLSTIKNTYYRIGFEISLRIIKLFMKLQLNIRSAIMQNYVYDCKNKHNVILIFTNMIQILLFISI